MGLEPADDDENLGPSERGSDEGRKPADDSADAAGAALTPGREPTTTAYDQLCVSYRAIDDFRTKLLGFLPLATGTGLLVLLSTLTRLDHDSPVYQLVTPVACFGLLVTLGLFVYEIYGIAKCADLIFRGRLLEEFLGLRDAKLKLSGAEFAKAQSTTKLVDRITVRAAPALGFGGDTDGMSYAQFGGRPQAVIHLLNEPFAAAIIYPAALAAWTYLALWGANIVNWSQRELAEAALAVLGVGFAVVWIYATLVSRYYERKIGWWRIEYYRKRTRAAASESAGTAPSGD